MSDGDRTHSGIDPAWAEDTSYDVSFTIDIHASNRTMAPKARLVLAKAIFEAAMRLKAQGLLIGGVAVVLMRSSYGPPKVIHLLPQKVTEDEPT